MGSVTWPARAGRPPRRSLLALAGITGATLGAAGAGAAATAPNLRPWYERLDKPAWTPPDAAFGPVWSVLYAAQAVAAWLAWRAGPAPGPALGLYGAQLALNLGWSLLFFGLRRPGWALVEIAVLWIAIAATVAAFARRSRVAAWLLVPYLAWVTFALALNAAIWRRNHS